MKRFEQQISKDQINPHLVQQNFEIL